MSGFFEHKEVKWSLAVMGVLSVLGLIGGSFFNIINTDSAVLLVETERIAEGYIPYATMHLNYPPLWYYINVAFKWLFHVPYGCYPFYLAVHWLYAGGCAACLYAISKKWGAATPVACFVAWLFFIITYQQQGNEVIFEIPGMFWGLLAICLYYRWQNRHPAWQILAGAVACCSFLTKQFGAGFLPLILWLMLTSSLLDKWKQMMTFIAGYCLPLLLCLAFFGTEMYRSILFNGYGTAEMDAFRGIETTPSMVLTRIAGNLFSLCNHQVPVVYVALLCLPLLFRQGKYREVLLCLFAIIGFALQFVFVHGGRHYLLYMIPFALLLVPLLMTIETNKILRYVILAVIGITTLNGVYAACHNRALKRYVLEGEHDYENQWKSGEYIINLVQDGETVFIPHVGLEYLYYTANLYPPRMAETGYCTGPMEVTVDVCAKNVAEADYVIHYTDEEICATSGGEVFEYFYTDSIRQYVDQFPSDTLENAVVVHKMVDNK